MAGGDLDDLYGGDVEAEEEREEEAEVARIRWSIPEMAVVVALSFFTDRPRVWSAIRQLAIAVLAAAVTWSIGHAIGAGAA